MCAERIYEQKGVSALLGQLGGGYAHGCLCLHDSSKCRFPDAYQKCVMVGYGRCLW